MNLRPQLLPAWLVILLANLVPVYGAFIGKLFFFQVLYLYWFESVLLIFFDVVRVILARGQEVDGESDTERAARLAHPRNTNNFFFKAALVIRLILVRLGLLLFYLLFIVLFIFLQVTDQSNMQLVLQTVIFRNPFFNTALGIFVISMVVQLVTGFLLNRKYRTASPLNYTSFFDFRTIVLHVMIIGVVFMHKFLFEGHTYAAKGEIVYVGLFMLGKALFEISHLNRQQADPQAMPMI